MARSARKQLADMRAMEEEDMRMTMHGSGKHFYGAGATPSMGLSQFRGGAKKGKKVKYEDEEYESEEEMEGGVIGRLAARLIPRLSARVAPTSTAIVPYVPRLAARPTSTALVSLGSAGRPIARPALSARQYGRMFQARPTASPFVRGPRAAFSRAATRFGPTAARALALGTTLGAVGSYLGDQFGADSGDTGYFDDYAGEEYIPPYETDTYVPPTTGEYAPEPMPLMPAEGDIPDDLTPDELAWYLQSGNLPARYAAAPSKRKRGKGKLTIHHEGGRSIPRERDTPKVAALKRELAALQELKKRGGPMTGGEQLRINNRIKAIQNELKRLGVQVGFRDPMPKVGLPTSRISPEEMKRQAEEARQLAEEQGADEAEQERVKKEIEDAIRRLNQRIPIVGTPVGRPSRPVVQPVVGRRPAVPIDPRTAREAVARTFTPQLGSIGSGKAKKGSARAAVVKRVMKERGCSLPEASKIVKAEGLY